MKKYLFLSLIFMVLLSCQEKQSYDAVEIGEKAPDFTLKALQGDKVSLSDYKGKVVVLEFWATWCPPCRESLPELQVLHNQYQGKDVIIMGVSVDEGKSARKFVTRFASELGITFQTLLSDDLTTRLYGITSIPVTFILDKEQRVVKRFLGFMPGMANELSKEIEVLL